MTIALIVAATIVALLIYAATKPDEFRVQRSTRIDAPADKIFSHIEDFRRWVDWSPYEQLDPAMRKSYNGPTSGTGAVYEWSGNNKAGEGRMEILEVDAPKRLAIDLRFVRPFRAHNMARFGLEPSGDSTNVTWGIEGKSPYMSKLMGVFVNMDRLIGKDFETGLSNLKTIAER
jgi:uncharacterized protein YndB with AHSA1/START domain